MIKKNVLKFSVCDTTYIEIVENIFKDYLKNKTNIIININPEIIVDNYKNDIIIKTFNNQQYQIPDGIGVLWALKLKGNNLKQRITGIDLMERICSKSSKYNGKIFLYGAKKDIAEKTKKELEKKYPKINIVGIVNGYEDEEKVIEKIISSDADILFVGLGSPKQEEFIIRNKEKLKRIKIFMPVGGSFDIISKELKRAPNWVMKLNLEWLYRLIQEPKRIKRYFKLIKFVFLIIFNREKE